MSEYNGYILPASSEEDIATYAAAVKAFDAGKISAQEFLPQLTFNGIYPQRGDAAYMLRIRVSAGVVTHEQLRCIAACARTYGNGTLHLTTRQDVQLHDLPLEKTPTLMTCLLSVGLGTRAGGGNAVRNVIAPVLSGLLPSDVFDVIPYAHEITTRLLATHTRPHLPRKCKIACVPSTHYSDMACTNDIGFVAEMRAGAPGFIVYCGGGMGARSRWGELLYEWIPAYECVRVAEAVIRVFDTHGDRNNKAKARFRFVCERLGIAKVREAVDAERAALQSDARFGCNVSPPKETTVVSSSRAVRSPFGEDVYRDTDGAYIRIYRQKDPAYVAVPLAIDNGILSTDACNALVAIAAKFSESATVRVTCDQDILVTHVPYDALSAFCDALQERGLAHMRKTSAISIIACTGADTCRLGICATRAVASACRAACAQVAVTSGRVVSPMTMRISGCPNACSQHPIAPMGFSGMRITQNGVKSDAFALYVRTDSSSFGVKTACVVTADKLPRLVAALYTDYITHAHESDTHTSYVARRGAAYFSTVYQPWAVTSSNSLRTGDDR